MLTYRQSRGSKAWSAAVRMRLKNTHDETVVNAVLNQLGDCEIYAQTTAIGVVFWLSSFSL